MKFIRLVFITLILPALSACNLTLAEDLTPPPGYVRPTPQATLGPLFPSAAPDVARGATLFAEKCAPCHGDAGMGDGPEGLQLPISVTALGLPEVGRTAAPSDWYTVITRGRMEKSMPSFDSLSEQERWDIISYALSLSVTAEQVEQGQGLFETHCPNCSTDIFTDQEKMAALSKTALVQLIRDGSDGLPAFGNNLTDDELWSVAAYLRTLSFPLIEPVTIPASDGVSGVPIETLAANTPEANLTPAIEVTITPAGTLGSFSGKVTNGSGGEVPAGLKVALHGLDQDASGNFSEPVTLESSTQAGGTFTFTNVPVPANRAFVAVLEYQGVEYTPSPVFADGMATSFELPITIYESTTDTLGLFVDRWHIFLNFDTPGVVQVIELWIISNPSNQTIIAASEAEPGLTFHLPENAANLQLQDGQIGDGRYIKTKDGFGTLAPILPSVGEFQAVFAYDLPYERFFELSWPVDLPVEAAIVMVPEGVRVRSDLLQQGETRQFQGVNVVTYNSQPLPVGANLTFNISGKPDGTGFSLFGLGQEQIILVAVGAIGVLFILAGVYMFWRDRIRPTNEKDAEELQDKNGILDAIIALDDMHKAGKLADEVYQARRAELKERLKDLMC